MFQRYLYFRDWAALRCMENRSRPTGVIVLAVLAILGGLIFLGGGGGLLFNGFSSQDPVMGLIGLGDLFIGTVALMTGVGFLNARPWSRILGFALSLVALVASGLVVSFGTHEGLSFQYQGLFYGVPVAIIMVYYLTRYDVEAYLLHGRARVQDR